MTKILLDLTLAENDGQISQCATVSFINLLYENTYLSSLINVMDRIFIYADDGEKKEKSFAVLYGKEITGADWKKRSRLCVTTI